MSAGSEWNHYNHNHQVTGGSVDEPVPGTSQNNNSDPYNYNYNTGPDYGQHEESNTLHQAEHFQPELTLDPSGQWYWDYQQQQWFPNYQQHHQPGQFDYETHQANAENDVVEQLAENLQQLSTSPTVGHHLLQPVILPASPVEVVEVVEAAEAVEVLEAESGVSDNSLRQHDPGEVDGVGAGALGPPDLVDHRPNSSQPELVSSLAGQQQQYQPPDLTFQPVASLGASLGSSLVSHDQHYEFYSQAYTASQPGPAQGMPDVTGQPLVSVGGEEEAPDILRTEPVVSGPANLGHSVPSSDRNLYMETGELAEEDVARAQDLAGHSSLPPMVGGNEQSGPLQRLVLGDSLGLGLGLAREVEGQSQPPPAQLPREPTEGESQPVPSVVPAPPPGGARVVPGLSVVPQPSPPAPPPDLPPSLGEARSEAAGSDRRDVTVMGPSVSRAPPPPTPGRDIAGEESAAGPGYRQRDLDSTDERDPDSDSGERYDNTRRRGASPRRVTDRSYRSSTDREEDRRYRNRREEERRFRRDEERKQRQERDNRSYYDARRRAEEDEDRRSHRGNSSRYERYSGRDYEDTRRREDSDEEDRRSHRAGNSSRYGVKREPRPDYDERSIRGYEDDRNSHRPSRPGSRAGSISYNPDSSMRGAMDMSNMSNMSMVFMQQHQAMLQEAMRQQMLALNPLGIQVTSIVFTSDQSKTKSKTFILVVVSLVKVFPCLVVSN